MSAPNQEEVAIIWAARDREVALNLAFMYAKNARLKGWWSKVTLVIWGPSAELTTQDAGLQKELKEMAKAGVELKACKACADRYQVSDKLEALGVEVLYTGQILTNWLKSGVQVLTF
ncbi:MAG: DsrE family protein [Pseudomonadota bacterium]